MSESNQTKWQGEVASELYGQILRSSALIGGSSALRIGAGIIRTKVLAVLLGPSGLGLFGLFSSIASLSQTIVGLGINESGVRQIAVASGSGNRSDIARTAAALRQMSILLGLLGGILVLVFSREISRVTFNSDRYSLEVSLLGAAVLFQIVSNGQAALIQGTRSLPDLAKMNVLGAFTGALLSVVLVFFLREQGIAPSLVAVALASLVFSWWYSSRIGIESYSLTVTQAKQEVLPLVSLGVAFMTSGMVTVGVSYAVRTIVLHKIGLEATGVYQAAWTLSGVYVGFILEAMGADFYPRLAAIADNHDECNRLVNAQMHVGILLAGPGIIAALTLAPAILSIFFSARFVLAAGVLRFICIGTALQVFTWPLNYTIVAKGKQRLFLLTEIAWGVISLVLAWICVSRLGLVGAGVAFVGAYVFYGLIHIPILRGLTGFEISPENKKICLLTFGLMVCVFVGFYTVPCWVAVLIGLVAAMLSTIYSIRTLARLMNAGCLPAVIQRLLARITH
jgi:PST family polysaccharide transporter